MTIKELKDIIRDWPETDATGEPTEVWMQTGPTTSSPLVGFEYLNMDAMGNAFKADLLLVPRSEPESYVKNGILVHKTGIQIETDGEEEFPKKGTLVEVLGYEKPGDWGLPRKGVVT